MLFFELFSNTKYPLYQITIMNMQYIVYFNCHITAKTFLDSFFLRNILFHSGNEKCKKRKSLTKKVNLSVSSLIKWHQCYDMLHVASRYGEHQHLKAENVK